jgi:hypothetical protein
MLFLAHTSTQCAALPRSSRGLEAAAGLRRQRHNSSCTCACCTFLLQDPPKDSAREAVRELHAKGVHLKVLTGDSVAVARKVCSQVGIPAEHTITGQAECKMHSPAGSAPLVACEPACCRADALQQYTEGCPPGCVVPAACLLAARLQGRSCRSGGQPSFAKQCARQQGWAG